MAAKGRIWTHFTVVRADKINLNLEDSQFAVCDRKTTLPIEDGIDAFFHRRSIVLRHIYVHLLKILVYCRVRVAEGHGAESDGRFMAQRLLQLQHKIQL